MRNVVYREVLEMQFVVVILLNLDHLFEASECAIVNYMGFFLFLFLKTVCVGTQNVLSSLKMK